MSEMTPAKATALRKPFPPESVGKLPKGGVMLDYVGHAAVTDRLLTVDPDWSWEPLALGTDGLPAYDRSGNLWIKLTVCGVTRLGVGDGKNPKEVIGDAIRNAAMRFGVALDLWAKENLVEFAQGVHAAEPIPQTTDNDPQADQPLPQTTDTKPLTMMTRRHMHALFNDLDIPDTQQLPGINKILGTDYESRKQLTEDDGKRIVAALAEKKRATS